MERRFFCLKQWLAWGVETSSLQCHWSPGTIFWLLWASLPICKIAKCSSSFCIVCTGSYQRHTQAPVSSLHLAQSIWNIRTMQLHMVASWLMLPFYVPLKNTLLSMIVKSPYQQPTLVGSVTKDNSFLRALNSIWKTKRG